ncbi:MAG: NADH-quinone oxidoreductase subunit NuoG [Chloroflexi bacterium]|nr:NADH-quinone oxidoreductase subunit NuoG [Chloroflexota bacterium]
MDNLATVTIDGRVVKVPRGMNLVEAARLAGVEIPVFCYHSKLKPVGACRMCYVAIEKVPGVVTACTTTVTDGMVVNTKDPRVVKAQQGVLEFLLANHPLDCPVCDRGGECPLQNNTFGYGGPVSRYVEPKRHFAKPIPLSRRILLDRERCILCYRCVRFQKEIAGDETLTVINRGARVEIATLPGREFDSPFSGNTIELCPVGALTSALYRFKARPWDIRSSPSLCDQCSVGCNVRVDTRNRQIVRLLSRENAAVDDGWLCDRGRFGYEFANHPDRLTQPQVREGTRLRAAEWEEALYQAAQGLRQVVSQRGPGTVGVLVSPRLANEDLYLAQRLARAVIGTSNLDYRLTPHPTVSPLRPDAASGSIVGLEKARTILILGADPLNHQPVLDLRLKKAASLGARLIVVDEKQTDLAAFARLWLRPRSGSLDTLARGLVHLILANGQVNQEFVDRRTEGIDALRARVADDTPERVAASTGVPAPLLEQAATLLATNGPASIVYDRDLGASDDGAAAVLAATDLALLTGNIGRDGAGLYPLVRAANEQGALDLGLMPRRPSPPTPSPTGGEGGHAGCPAGGMTGAEMLDALRAGQLKALYLLGVDPLRELPDDRALRDGLTGLTTLIVQDILPGPAQELATVVLPGAAFHEREGTLTNLERRVQRLWPALKPPGKARPDWQIIHDLARALGTSFDYAQASDVFAEIASVVPTYRGLTYGKVGLKGVQWPLDVASGQEAGSLYEDPGDTRLAFTPVAPSTARIV